jgi:hypothetical protein
MQDKIDITGLVFMLILFWAMRSEIKEWFLDKLEAFAHKFAEMMEPVMEDN